MHPKFSFVHVGIDTCEGRVVQIIILVSGT